MSTLAVSGRRFSWRWLMYLVLVAGVVAFLVPVYMVVVTALKRPIDINLDTSWNLPKVWNWASFQQAWTAFAPKLRNSLVLTIVASLVSALMGSLNGYVLSKWSFRGSRLMFSLMLFGMFIPYQSILIPLFGFIKAIGLYGTVWGLVVVHVIYGLPITTLIFRNNYVDNGEAKRYREVLSMPGFEIDALNGRSFVKGMLELNLPPIRFEALGSPGFYGSWIRPALFTTALVTNPDSPRDKVEAFNVGLQFDLQLHVLNRLPMMLSLGYARGFEGDGHGEDEIMLSLKVL